MRYSLNSCYPLDDSIIVHYILPYITPPFMEFRLRLTNGPATLLAAVRVRGLKDMHYVDPVIVTISGTIVAILGSWYIRNIPLLPGGRST